MTNLNVAKLKVDRSVVIASSHSVTCPNAINKVGMMNKIETRVVKVKSNIITVLNHRDKFMDD